MLKHYRILFVFLSIGFANSLSAQLNQAIVYNRGFDNLIPKYIIPAHDQGLIISGSHNRSEFVMKVDSLNKPMWVRQVFETPNNDFVFSESVVSYTDSTYMMVSPYKPVDSTYNLLSIAEIAEDGNVFSKRLVDFGESVFPIKQIVPEDNKSLVMMNGVSNTLINLDSLGYPMWALSYQNEVSSLRFARMEVESDSSFLVLGTSEGDLFISSMNHSGEINWSRQVNLNIESFNEGIDVLIQDSTINILVATYFDGLNLIKLDRNGNYISGHSINYIRDEFNYYNKAGFMDFDSSGFIVYAGNSIFKISPEGEVLKSIGDHVAIKGYYKTDSTFYLLVKNGFIPVLAAVSQGNEMGMLVGDYLSEVFDSEDICIYSGYAGFSVEIQLESDTLIVNQSNVDFTVIDSVSLINGLSMDMQFSCPDAPSSVSEISASDIKIYPNPTNNLFTVKSEEKVQEITIYNGFGQLVARSSEIDVEEIQFDTSSWTDGMYYVQFSINDKLVSKRVVVGK